jgi:hypothetical protein
VSGGCESPGARHLTPAAVFALLIGLLLLTLSPPCPHVEGSQQAVTTSAASAHASSPQDTGTGSSCTVTSGSVRTAARTADNVRPDDSGSNSDAVHAQAKAEIGAACPHHFAAATAQTAQPHGWRLLILLETARI